MGRRFRQAIAKLVERMIVNPRQFPIVFKNVRRALCAAFHIRYSSSSKTKPRLSDHSSSAAPVSSGFPVSSGSSRRVTPPPNRGTRLRKDMANLDWSQCAAVESIPGRLSGAWVFRDTRMPVSAVFENLGAGASVGRLSTSLTSRGNRSTRSLNLRPAVSIRSRPRSPPQTPPWMLILFDHVTPRGIARLLPGHTVTKGQKSEDGIR